MFPVAVTFGKDFYLTLICLLYTQILTSVTGILVAGQWNQWLFLLALIYVVAKHGFLWTSDHMLTGLSLLMLAWTDKLCRISYTVRCILFTNTLISKLSVKTLCHKLWAYWIIWQGIIMHMTPHKLDWITWWILAACQIQIIWLPW